MTTCRYVFHLQLTASSAESTATPVRQSAAFRRVWGAEKMVVFQVRIESHITTYSQNRQHYLSA